MTGAEASATPPPDPDPVTARPPRGPLVAVGAVAAVTAPLALLAVVLGDVGLGLLAVISAGWAGSLAYLGWTARADADAEAVEVTWMRSTARAPWSEVVAIEVDDGAGWGSGRGALLRLDGGSTVRWTPWLPVLWFAARSARRSVDELLALASVASEASGRTIEVHRER